MSGDSQAGDEQTETDELDKQLRTALVSDFKDLYTKEYTTDYRAKRIVQSIEIDIMELANTKKLVEAWSRQQTAQVLDKLLEQKEAVYRVEFVELGVVKQAVPVAAIAALRVGLESDND